MHEAVQAFVERMGVMMEGHGLPRIAGRLYGFLLLHEEPYPLDELADLLQVSKASVSTNARLLEQHGLLELTSAPGDRRDFYRVGPNSQERMLRAAQRKFREMIEVFEHAGASLPPEIEGGRERLREATRFHRLMLDGVDRLVEQWKTGGEGGGEAEDERVRRAG